MSKKEDNTSIRALLEEFEAVITWFESEDFSLEEALKKYKEAEALSNEIEKRLSAAKNDISTIKQRFDS